MCFNYVVRFKWYKLPFDFFIKHKQYPLWNVFAYGEHMCSQKSETYLNINSLETAIFEVLLSVFQLEGFDIHQSTVAIIVVTLRSQGRE